jgi:hypothetical protein
MTAFLAAVPEGPPLLKMAGDYFVHGVFDVADVLSILSGGGFALGTCFLLSSKGGTSCSGSEGA